MKLFRDKFYYCLRCNKFNSSVCKGASCTPQDSVYIPVIKLSRREKFYIWMLDHDLFYYLQLASGCIINAIVIQRLDLSAWERIVEPICAGFFLVGIIKK